MEVFTWNLVNYHFLTNFIIFILSLLFGFFLYLFFYFLSYLPFLPFTDLSFYPFFGRKKNIFVTTSLSWSLHNVNKGKVFHKIKIPYFSQVFAKFLIKVFPSFIILHFFFECSWKKSLHYTLDPPLLSLLNFLSRIREILKKKENCTKEREKKFELMK